MSTSTVTFYPVGNGAMTLLVFNNPAKTSVLVDVHIRTSASDDNESDDYYDVTTALRKALKRDDKNRPYVDALLITHNDKDHVGGLEEVFHLGPLVDYKAPKEGEEGKIVIQEMWSSYRFWKRESDTNTLTSDAKTFNREMKRRVALFETKKSVQGAGDRAIIFCKDPEGKTDGIMTIVRVLDSEFTQINGTELAGKVRVKVLGPLPKHEEEDDTEFDEKNRGCVVLSLAVMEGIYENRVLLPGDAEVSVWEQLWAKWSKAKQTLAYDLLLTPHHTSWHSLSNDSRSECDDPQVSADAKSALSQSKSGAFIVSSSKPIKDDDEDPPCFAAKKEYVAMIEENRFLCTEEYPNEDSVDPIVINLTGSGPQEGARKAKVRSSTAAVAATGAALPHGSE